MDDLIVTTSWDDGHPLDLKLAKLLKKYGIPATFYIPIESIERETMSSNQIKRISKNFDIGGHTYHHLDLTSITENEAYYEILEGKRILEEITGKKIETFCYPGGFYNNKIKELVKKAGFKMARTIRMLEYLPPNDRYQVGTTIFVGCNSRGHFRHAFLKRSLSNLKLPLWLLYKRSFDGWVEMTKDSLDFMKNNGGILHLWGHSWKIDKREQWKELESLFQTISNIEGIKIVDNSDLIEYMPSSI